MNDIKVAADFLGLHIIIIELIIMWFALEGVMDKQIHKSCEISRFFSHFSEFVTANPCSSYFFLSNQSVSLQWASDH